MNLNFSDEQNLLREQIQKFCNSDYDFYDREDFINTEAALILKSGNFLQNKVGLLCRFQVNLVVLILDQ